MEDIKKRMNEDFRRWDIQDPGDNFPPIATFLRSRKSRDLKNFLAENFDSGKRFGIDDIWEICFEYYRGNPPRTKKRLIAAMEKLSKDELVYLILECENRWYFAPPSFFVLFPRYGKYFTNEEP